MISKYNSINKQLQNKSSNGYQRTSFTVNSMLNFKHYDITLTYAKLYHRCIIEPLRSHRKAFDYNFAPLGQDCLLLKKFRLLLKYLARERENESGKV